MHFFLFRFRSTFALTQRQVQLYCFAFLDAVLAIILTTQGATIEQAHICNNPKLLLRKQMEFTCILLLTLLPVSNVYFRNSLVMQL